MSDNFMRKTKPYSSLPTFVACLTLAVLGGCSGTGDSVIHVEGTRASVTKAMLNHWMRALVGADFRASVGTRGPTGLVAEPANYSECAAAARKIIPKSTSGSLALSDPQIGHTCRELYSAVKEQALSFLLSVEWTVAEGAEHGLHVSREELYAEFSRMRKSVYPRETDLRRYLADRHWILADLLYELKRSILVTKLAPKFEALVKRAGGGEAVYARLALAHYRDLIAKTSCEPGYITLGCKEYHRARAGLPSPNVLLEGLAKGRDS